MIADNRAKIINLASSPPVIGTFFIFHTFFLLTYNLTLLFYSLSTILIFVIILPTLFNLLLLKKGMVSNFHLRNKGERILPVAFVIISGFLGIFVLSQIHHSQTLNEIMILFFLSGLGFFFITLFYKISGHVFVFTSAITLTAIYFYPLIFFALFLNFPIGWARLKTKEHTFFELIIGFFYALISIYLIKNNLYLIY